MNEKQLKYLTAIACVILCVAILVTFVDIKIKNDLLNLAQRTEDKLGVGDESIRRPEGRNNPIRGMDRTIRRVPMVDIHTPMETQNGDGSDISTEESRWETVGLFGDDDPRIQGPN